MHAHKHIEIQSKIYIYIYSRPYTHAPIPHGKAQNGFIYKHKKQTQPRTYVNIHTYLCIHIYAGVYALAYIHIDFVLHIWIYPTGTYPYI